MARETTSGSTGNDLEGWPYRYAIPEVDRTPINWMETPDILVPQDELELIVAAWDPPKDLVGVFRWPLCAKCGRECAEPVYHCWLEDRYREIHLCRECGEPYAV